LPQDRLDLVHLEAGARGGVIQGREQVVHGRREIAVLVDAVNDARRDYAIARRERRQPHLPRQVIAQRDRAAVAPVNVRPGVAAVRAIGAGGGRIEGVVPVLIRCFRFGHRRVVGIGTLAGLGGIGGGRFVLLGTVVGGRFLAFGLAFALFDFLEQRIRFEDVLDFLLQLDRRKLQQPDGLLKLRRDGQVLTELEVERLFHFVFGSCDAPGPASPRPQFIPLSRV